MTPVDNQMAIWCKRGHAMEGDNVFRGKRGEMQCRECLIDHLRAVRKWRVREREG
jgi:hypothetical protein